jgi:hypothetical protein
MTTMDTNQATAADVLRRYPSLAGHLICQSLGYFTPRKAAAAIASHKNAEEYCCEWYSHMVGLRLKHGKAGGERPAEAEWTAEALQVNRETIEAAFRYRHTHTGMMAHYPQAKALVDAVRQGGEGPVFASWM